MLFLAVLPKLSAQVNLISNQKNTINNMACNIPNVQVHFLFIHQYKNFIMKNLKTALLLMVTFLMFHSNANAQLNNSQSKALIKKELQNHFQSDEPGVTLIVAKKGEIVFSGAAGMANLELNVPMKANNVLRIGSITKQFTAIAILMLQEQGKLSIQDDISKFLPSYPTKDKKITIEHLLTHTSGIRSYTSLPGFMQKIRDDKSTSEMLDVFKDKDMLFDPGTEFSYNNSGYFLLGVIIEKVSGMTYEDFIEKNIFEKIGMKNSYYGRADQIIPNRASGYELENGEIINAPYLSMTIPYAAGSLLSTVEDLYKWNQAVHKYQLVKKASLDKAITSYVLKNGESTDYGYGWGVNSFYGGKTIQHSGGINGFTTNVMYLPEQDIFIAAFSNGKDPSFFTQLIAAKMIGKYPITEKKSLNSELLADYVGIYQVENSKDKRTIKIKDGHLTSFRTGGNLLNLYSYDKDKFYFEKSLDIFEFKRNKEGKVVGIIASLPSGKTGRAFKTDEKPVERKEVKLDHKTLQKYVGVFEIGPGFALDFSIENNSLWLIAPGEPKLQVFAEGDHKFFLKDVDAHLEFKEFENKITEVKVNLGNETHIAYKKES